MGLTINFKLVAPPGTDERGAEALVRHLRRRALGFKQRGRVDRVHPLRRDAQSLRRAREWMQRPDSFQPNRFYQADVFPLAGFIFAVSVGEDCEPLWLGLCRYPSSVALGGRRVRTRLNGWRLHGFCKTQYASLHGWEHFRRCHTAVIDLLAGARKSGLGVEIEDEGDYWPGRNEAALRRNLDEMNGAVAAVAGALKDLHGDTDGPGIESPIFAHPQFERLEAQGASRGAARLVRRPE
jgi:hypothetical protein